MTFDEKDDKEFERRLAAYKYTITDEAKRDLNVDDIIRMLEEKRKYNQSDLLKNAISDAKKVRETALNNAKMRIEQNFDKRYNTIISKESTNIIKEFNNELKYHIGESVKMGISGAKGVYGTAGLAGITGKSGTSSNLLNAFHNINPFTEMLSGLNRLVKEKECASTEESFDNLIESEFKESVKKLYEQYKI